MTRAELQKDLLCRLPGVTFTEHADERQPFGQFFAWFNGHCLMYWTRDGENWHCEEL